MTGRMIDWIVRRYGLIAGIATVVFVFFAFQVPRVKIDNSVDNFLAKDHFLNREGSVNDRIFGPGSGIIVAVEAADIYSVPFMKNLLAFTREMDRLNSRIIAATGKAVRAGIRNTLGLDRKAGAAAYAFLSSLPVKPVSVSELDLKFSVDEMVMIEDQSVVPVIIRAYRGLSPEKKAALLKALSPAYVREAFSIATADYVEGEGNKFKVEKMIDRDVADSGKINAKTIEKMRTRIGRWDIYDRFLISRRVPGTVPAPLFRRYLSRLEGTGQTLLRKWYRRSGAVFTTRRDAPLQTLEPVMGKAGYRRSVTVLIRLENTTKAISETALRFARQVIREYNLYRVFITGADGVPLRAKNRLGEIRPFMLLSGADLSRFASQRGIPADRNGRWQGSATGKDGRTYRLEAPLFPPDENPVRVAGEPVVTTMLGTSMVGDLKILVPFVLIVVMASLLIAFRQFGPMIIPLIGVLYSTVMVVGLMGMLGVSLTVISVVLPVLMIAVGSAYGIHVVNHFQAHPHPELREAVRLSLRHVLTPVAMAAFTTVGGFLALVTNGVVPVRNFGLFTGIGVFFSFAISVTLVPALLVLFRVRRTAPEKDGGETVRQNRFLQAVSRTAVRRNIPVLIIAGVLFLVSAAAAVYVRVDTNGVRMFKESSEIRQADMYLNANFKGTSTSEIVIRKKGLNSALTPGILRMVDGLETYLKKDPEIGQYVGGVLSVADYIKKANRAMHGEDASYYRIPETQAAILDFMLILKKDTDNVCSPEGDRIKVLLTMRTGSTSVARILKKRLEEYFGRHGESPLYLGMLMKYLEVDSLVVMGQVFSMLLSLLVVFLLNSLVFRSVIEAAISLVPLVITILLNFAVMAVFGILLDVATSMIASVAIGIGIDYTIHFLSGFKSRYLESGDLEASLSGTGLVTGRAILYNATAVMFGFAVLPFSSFIPLINFGTLIALTMITTAMASLTVIPAILVQVRKMPFFLRLMEREKIQFERALRFAGKGRNG